VIDNLRRLIKASGKTLDYIFAQIDTDGSGDITPLEFRKAMKMVSLNLTDTEI
jgi:Ca2+-binding EF-hand superfamily protein